MKTTLKNTPVPCEEVRDANHPSTADNRVIQAICRLFDQTFTITHDTKEVELREGTSWLSLMKVDADDAQWWEGCLVVNDEEDDEIIVNFFQDGFSLCQFKKMNAGSTLLYAYELLCEKMK